MQARNKFVKYQNIFKKLSWLFTNRPQKNIPWPLFMGYSIILLACAVFFLVQSSKILGDWHFESVRRYTQALWQGYQYTLLLAFLVLIGSLFLGSVLTLFARSGCYLLRIFSYWLLQICRGTPLIVFIVFCYYIVAQAVGIQSRMLSGVLILSLYFSTAISEILRGGFKSIPQTQYEVAQSFGLTSVQTYLYIILPQLIQRILPALTNQIGIIVKDTSLLSVIGIAEFYQTSTNAANQSYATLEFFLILALGYLVITLPISLISKALEKTEGDMS